MQINTLHEFLDKYIEGYLLKDLMSVKNDISPDKHPGNAAYLMTAAICAGIEFLGTLSTEQEVLAGCNHCGKPEQIRNKFPLDHYCKYYLAQVDSRYKNLGPVLRELIRNGIAHSFATKGNIGITRVSRSDDLHLVRMTKEGFLVINSDRFYDDFAKSYLDFFKPDISTDKDKEQLALENYQRLKSQKSVEIDRTMMAMKGKLENWKWLYPDIEHMDHMVEQVEEYGGLEFVS